ncbi:transposase [Deinococcus wulumuqiensis R12]|nr:transposase [Deinococcus wulumuqiensis R12]
MHLTDEQWGVLAPLIPQPVKRTARGRPVRDDREVLEGILWILRADTQWIELPQGECPPNSTCHERFQKWNEQNAPPRHSGIELIRIPIESGRFRFNPTCKAAQQSGCE